MKINKKRGSLLLEFGLALSLGIFICLYLAQHIVFFFKKTYMAIKKEHALLREMVVLDALVDTMASSKKIDFQLSKGLLAISCWSMVRDLEEPIVNEILWQQQDGTMRRIEGKLTPLLYGNVLHNMCYDENDRLLVYTNVFGVKCYVKI